MIVLNARGISPYKYGVEWHYALESDENNGLKQTYLLPLRGIKSIGFRALEGKLNEFSV